MRTMGRVFCHKHNIIVLVRKGYPVESRICDCSFTDDYIKKNAVVIGYFLADGTRIINNKIRVGGTWKVERKGK